MKNITTSAEIEIQKSKRPDKKKKNWKRGDSNKIRKHHKPS